MILEPESVDLFLKIRPGAFAANAAYILAAVKRAARAGVRELELPADLLRGGDCGALNDHPAFQRALAAAQTRFERRVAALRDAPRLKYVTDDRPLRVEGPGPDARAPFLGAPERVFAIQTLGLARRLAAIGCRHVVIGLSGGLDSALALLVAARAFALLGYDASGLHVYTLPGFGTTKRTRTNAEKLAEGLGLALERVDITPACRQHFKDLGHDPARRDIVYENTQARLRTLFLMDKANQLGGIVLGTGDMSEIALGWCTYNGDHMSMYGVNAGVPKTAVREVCAWWAARARDAAAAAGRADAPVCTAAAALEDILATPVSPELLPAEHGRIAQKTEDRVGPYELHDFFLWHFAAEGEGRAEILAAAKKAFRGAYDAKTVARWLDVFLRRFLQQAFKRNCAPDGTQVYDVYLAPTAWRCPSDIAADWAFTGARK